MIEAEVGLIPFEDEGATSQGMQVAPLAAGKGEEMDSLLVSRRNSALDFSSMRLILDFQPLEL